MPASPARQCLERQGCRAKDLRVAEERLLPLHEHVRCAIAIQVAGGEGEGGEVIGIPAVAVEEEPWRVERGLPEEVSIAPGASDGGVAPHRPEHGIAGCPHLTDQAIAEAVAVEVAARTEWRG